MATQVVPTGIGFLDEMLGGGTKPAGVYGILSPTGVGKSVLATMIACNGAAGGSIMSPQRPVRGRWFLIDLHNDNAVVQRCISYWSRIAWDHTDRRSENHEAPCHERERAEMMSESKRLELGFARVFANLRLIRYHQVHMGTQLIDCPEWGLPRDECEIGGIVVDGASHLWFHEQDTSDLYYNQYLEELVSVRLRKLAEYLNAPVWVTHHIAGHRSDARPTEILTHRDAADCKTFADSMDACVVIGTRSGNCTGDVFSIQCTKRHSIGGTQDRMLIEHDSRYAGLVPAVGWTEHRRKGVWVRVNERKPLLSASNQRLIETWMEEAQTESARDVDFQKRHREARSAKQTKSSPGKPKSPSPNRHS